MANKGKSLEDKVLDVAGKVKPEDEKPLSSTTKIEKRDTIQRTKNAPKSESWFKTLKNTYWNSIEPFLGSLLWGTVVVTALGIGMYSCHNKTEQRKQAEHVSITQKQNLPSHSTYTVPQQAIYNPQALLPQGAFIAEKREVAPGREIVLWMLNPTKHERKPVDALDAKSYSCPEQPRGNYYSGPTRISLLDMNKNKIINTLEIRTAFYQDKDSFDVPFKIQRHYYHVDQITDSYTEEGKPTLLYFEDINGDGKPQEFVLYCRESGIDLETVLIGYSEKRDKLIRYPIKATSISQEGKKEHLSYYPEPQTSGIVQWSDNLFWHRMEGKDYILTGHNDTGRGGDQVYESIVRYLPEHECFERFDFEGHSQEEVESLEKKYLGEVVTHKTQGRSVVDYLKELNKNLILQSTPNR